MRTSLIFIFLIGWILTGMVSFISKPTSPTVHILLTISGNPTGSNVLITKSNALNYIKDTLISSKIESPEKSILVFSLAQPTFAELRIGNKRNELYLMPGDDLQIFIDFSNSNSMVSFTGKGADINNYLAQAAVVQQKNMFHKGQYINELESQLFIDRLDTLTKALNDFHTRYINTHSLPENVNNLLKTKHNLFVLSFAQNYVDHYFGTFKTKAQTPKRLKNLPDRISFDTTLLNSGLMNYFSMLDSYYYAKFYEPFFEATDNPQTIDSTFHILPQIADVKIRTSKLSSPFKEYLLAKNCHLGLKNLGLIPITESLFTDFSRQYSTSPYLPFLQKQYNQWLSVVRGTNAPDFTGETPDGRKLSLSDLKGKIVYADMWATWCGPCRAEFPKAKELKVQFEDNNEVIFLYISIDTDKNTWRKFLKTANSPQGIHINISDEEHRKVAQNYVLGGGVPKYFLIDQQGKIISTNAPRPSSGKVENEIRALLK